MRAGKRENMRFIGISILVVIFVRISLFGQQDKSILLENKILIIESEGIAFLGSGITEDHAKTLAINDAKRNALERAGTYLESHTEILEHALVKDEVLTYTGGLSKVRVLKENRTIVNNMFAFGVVIQATIDTRLLNERIAELRRNDHLRRQLEAERKRSERLEARVAALMDSSSTASATDVANLVNALSASEWFEKATETEDIHIKIDYYTRVIALDSLYTYAYNNRGYAYDELGQYDEAIDDYTKAIELEPDLASLYNNRGETYNDVGLYDEALDDLNRAIALDSVFSYAYSNRGNSYRGLGQYDEAISDFNRAISLHPEFATAYSNRGSSYYDLDLYDEALRDYNKAIALDPEFAYAYYNLGETFRILGRKKESAHNFNEYLRLHGNKDGDADDVRQMIRDLGYKPKY